MKRLLQLFAVFTLAGTVMLGLAGCKRGAQEAASPPGPSGAVKTETPPSTPEKQYDIKGKVVSVAADKRAVTLDHEDIPGLMKAMKMEYRVEDPKVLESVNAGDNVSGHLKATNGNYLITHLQKQ